MNGPNKGKQVVPGKGPAASDSFQAYSSAKPLNHDTFSRDMRTRYNQILANLATQVQWGRGHLDDPEDIKTMREHVAAALKEVTAILESAKQKK